MHGPYAFTGNTQKILVGTLDNRTFKKNKTYAPMKARHFFYSRENYIFGRTNSVYISRKKKLKKHDFCKQWWEMCRRPAYLLHEQLRYTCLCYKRTTKYPDVSCNIHSILHAQKHVTDSKNSMSFCRLNRTRSQTIRSFNVLSL